MMPPLEDCDYRCAECGRKVCRDNEEHERRGVLVCGDCAAPESHCGVLRRHDEHDWVGYRPPSVAGPAWAEPVDYYCPGVIVIEGGHLEVMR